MAKQAFVTGGSGFIGRNLIAMLIERGYNVKALARSDAAANTVLQLGAQPVRGDLNQESALRDGMVNTDIVFHLAAYVVETGSYHDFYQGNVEGTEHVLNAARQSGVKRLVFVSSEAVLMGGKPIINADESQPYPKKPMGYYALTKGLAEQRVRSANTSAFSTVMVRPRLVWGKGDTTVLPVLSDAAKTGRLVWIGGGHQLTSTCHVTNTCEGIIAAAERGKAGEIYFLTDGTPVEFRTFVTKMLQTQHITPGNQELPLWLARTAANVLEGLWGLLRLKGLPPLTKTIVAQIGTEVTVNDAKARRELGYKASVSMEDGLREMSI